MMNKIKQFLVVFFLFFGISNGAVRADTLTWKCDYTQLSDTDGLSVLDEPFTLTFVLDTEDSTAYLVGNLGSSKIHPFLHNSDGDGISFLEVTDSGNLMTTAIVSGGKSVHSRNTIMFGNSRSF